MHSEQKHIGISYTYSFPLLKKNLSNLHWEQKINMLNSAEHFERYVKRVRTTALDVYCFIFIDFITTLA